MTEATDLYSHTHIIWGKSESGALLEYIVVQRVTTSSYTL